MRPSRATPAWRDSGSTRTTSRASACLGAIAAVDPGIISIEAVEEHLREKTKDEHRAQAARDAYNATLRRIKLVAPGEGIDWPHEVPVLPKWHEFEEGGVVVPAVKRGFEMGPRGQSRNDMFKRGTTKTHRPVVRFDLCIKCTLCWLDCPDECFDPIDDGLYDVNYEFCVGCGKCAAVCPVPECIVMVDELKFDRRQQPLGAHKRNPVEYIEWAEEKKGKDRISYPHVTGTGYRSHGRKDGAAQGDDGGGPRLARRHNVSGGHEPWPPYLKNRRSGREELLLNGCQAVAQGVKLADVDVIAAYPIRPYTEVMDALSKIIADGELDAEYIVADTEHSQFEIVKHASSVGARAFAGSSGTGWMYGFEALVVTATDRLSPLFLVGNRALDDPGAFGVEHNDALSIRDMGWLLCWATTAQEALEHVLIGYRIAEDNRVRMPMALAMDGAFLTHSQHMVKLPTPGGRPALSAAVRPGQSSHASGQSGLDRAAGQRRLGHGAAPAELGSGAAGERRCRAGLQGVQRDLRRPLRDAVFRRVHDRGRGGRTASASALWRCPARTAVRRLREKGKKVGYVNLRWFRPFPSEELRAVLGRMKAVGVIDRDFAHGSPDSGGIVVHDIRSCLYPLTKRPAIANFIGGLGGRDISIDDCIRMFEVTSQAPNRAPGDELVTWIGLRE